MLCLACLQRGQDGRGQRGGERGQGTPGIPARGTQPGGGRGKPRKKKNGKTRRKIKSPRTLKSKARHRRGHLGSPRRANATIKRLREEQDQILKAGQPPAGALQNALSETGSFIYLFIYLFSLPRSPNGCSLRSQLRGRENVLPTAGARAGTPGNPLPFEVSGEAGGASAGLSAGKVAKK